MPIILLLGVCRHLYLVHSIIATLATTELIAINDYNYLVLSV